MTLSPELLTKTLADRNHCVLTILVERATGAHQTRRITNKSEDGCCRSRCEAIDRGGRETNGRCACRQSSVSQAPLVHDSSWPSHVKRSSWWLSPPSLSCLFLFFRPLVLESDAMSRRGRISHSNISLPIELSSIVNLAPSQPQCDKVVSPSGPLADYELNRPYRAATPKVCSEENG